MFGAPGGDEGAPEGELGACSALSEPLVECQQGNARGARLRGYRRSWRWRGWAWWSRNRQSRYLRCPCAHCGEGAPRSRTCHPNSTRPGHSCRRPHGKSSPYPPSALRSREARRSARHTTTAAVNPCARSSQHTQYAVRGEMCLDAAVMQKLRHRDARGPATNHRHAAGGLENRNLALRAAW
jgi:hypothetical protein